MIDDDDDGGGSCCRIRSLSNPAEAHTKRFKSKQPRSYIVGKLNGASPCSSLPLYNVGPGWIGGFQEQPNKCMCWWNFRDHAVEYILSFPIPRRRLLQQYIILPNIRQRERTQGGTQIHFNFLLNGIPASSIAFPVHLLFTWSVVCSKVAIIIIIYGYRLHFEVSSNGTMGNERSCVVYSVQVAVECFRYVAHMYCWWLLWWRGGGGSFVVAAIVCCVGDQESLNCKLW